MLVKVEGSSALDGSSAEYVVYTDLVGSTVANCMMRTASAVEYEWLKCPPSGLKDDDWLTRIRPEITSVAFQ